MADWEEIKRLAADFQRTQTSDTLQRISERNCIDILKKLTDLSLIELIYTCDGKEFVTPEHLLKEIEDEVYYNGGRVHLHDLATRLNVDYQHIENKAKELTRDRPGVYNLILGQIIHQNYKVTLGKTIHDTMISFGRISIAEFAKSLDLPSEFLLEMVKEILPTIMDDYVASPDGRTFFTTDMMDRYRAIVSGTLSAITKPATIASIMKRLDLSEKMFLPIVENLIKEGRIDAVVENRSFIPAIYAREQNEYIDKFYATNSYIDYDLLSRRDIKQPKAFLKKRFPDGIQLKNCLISLNLLSQVELMVEDCMASNNLIDISTILPASFQPEDIEQLLKDLFKRNKLINSNCFILLQTNVCSLGYIEALKEKFESMMTDKAKKHLQEGVLVKYFLDGKIELLRPKQQQQQQSEELSREQSEIVEEANKNEQSIKEGDGESANRETKQHVTTRQKGDDIELTPEDLKREKRQKKGKQPRTLEESIPEEPEKESKGAKSAGGGGKKGGCAGTQGREIKQRATKKKYLSGKSKLQSANDDDDDDGRNVKRATPASTAVQTSKTPDREPLEFMSREEMIKALMNESSERLPEEVLDSIVSNMVDELNKKYESFAKKTLDEHLESLRQSEVSFI